MFTHNTVLKECSSLKLSEVLPNEGMKVPVDDPIFAAVKPSLRKEESSTFTTFALSFLLNYSHTKILFFVFRNIQVR